MIQTQLINNVIAWERRLEWNEERRKHHQSEPYVNYLAAPQPCQKGRNQRKESRSFADFVKVLMPNV